MRRYCTTSLTWVMKSLIKMAHSLKNLLKIMMEKFMEIEVRDLFFGGNYLFNNTLIAELLFMQLKTTKL